MKKQNSVKISGVIHKVTGTSNDTFYFVLKNDDGYFDVRTSEEMDESMVGSKVTIIGTLNSFLSKETNTKGFRIPKTFILVDTMYDE